MAAMLLPNSNKTEQKKTNLIIMAVISVKFKNKKENEKVK
jgi:hypothetical protein